MSEQCTGDIRKEFPGSKGEKTKTTTTTTTNLKTS
jgi:hypothetical protein